MTVATLAAESESDLDEVLVTLWDAGIEYPNDQYTLIKTADVRRAKASLGLDDIKAQTSVDYWLERSGLGRSELCQRLAELDITLGPDARRIPKNSLRRLRSMFGDRPTVRAQEQAGARPPTPLPPFLWETVGNCPIRRYLTTEQIAAIHHALVEDFQNSGDPIDPPGLRAPDLLSSAAHRPQTSLGDYLKYPTAEMASAALFHSVVLNHAFFNGNKRTGLVALMAMLDENDLVLTCTEEDLFKFTLKVAAHGLVPAHADQIADRETNEISRWIKSNVRQINRGERPMKWHKLKSKLRDFKCEFEPAGGVGNRINIWRPVERKRMLGLRSRTDVLRTQVAWSGDGTEADRNTIHKIRADLELDDAHDVDSTLFYEGAEIDAFIVDYRRILRRLAKL